MIKLIVRIVFVCCFLPSLGVAQSYSPITLYQQFNGPYDYTIIGKTHNTYDNWISPPQPPAMLSSSSASLNLPSNQTIVGAYLVWSGIGNGAGTNLNLNGAFVRDYSLDGNSGEVEILASEIGKGMYIYSLNQNGQEIISKRMIVK